MIPRKFRKSSPIIKSFDWIDYTAGLGYKKFYALGTTITGASIDYLLTSQILEGQPVSASGTLLANGTLTTLYDLDFDITVGASCILGGGDAFMNILTSQGGISGSTQTCYQVITLYHVDSAGTETSIGTVTTPSNSNGASERYFRDCVNFAVTKKAFALGDKIRLNIIGKGTNSDNNPRAGCVLYFDPAGRKASVTDNATQLSSSDELFIFLPFKIDI